MGRLQVQTSSTKNLINTIVIFFEKIKIYSFWDYSRTLRLLVV